VKGRRGWETNNEDVRLAARTRGSVREKTEIGGAEVPGWAVENFRVTMSRECTMTDAVKTLGRAWAGDMKREFAEGY
jgi:hypothetical protein